MKKTNNYLTAFVMIVGLLNSMPQLTYAKNVKETATAPNLEREKRMATEVEDAILDGDVIFLKSQKTSSHEFMAIDTQPDDTHKAKGAIILLHGRGFHPDWTDTIQPLRVQLAENGWRTLSVQMPVLEKTAKYYDYTSLFPAASARIETAIHYLKNQGEANIILFAHSCGAHMAMHWVDKSGDAMISAFIGAGMGATDYKQSMKQPFPLEKMKLPVLDIYGDNDYPAVLKMAINRKAAIDKAGNKKSKQVTVTGADHYFTDKGDELVKAVLEWLNKQSTI